MEFTLGYLMVGISIFGIIGCIISMVVSEKVFKKQRYKLLKSIEME